MSVLTVSDENTSSAFLDAAQAWVCDGYSCDMRFMASHSPQGYSIWEAAIYFNPLPPLQDLNMIVDCDRVIVGQQQLNNQKKSKLFGLINNAINGVLEIPGKTLELPRDRSLYLYSEMSNRDRRFYDLHLFVGGAVRPNPPQSELALIDNALRAATPPFDGLSDILHWLNLSNPASDSRSSGINLRVGPPVDMIINESTLREDKLHLVLHAHPKFETRHVGLAVRGVPEDGLHSRRQLSGEIRWSRVKNGRKIGEVDVQIKGTDSAVVMLMIGSSTVRRQWLVDATKARNHRLVAIQNFDKDLKRIRQAVLENADSAKFENGIAALLFLLGFSPSVQIETDSPDLVVATPFGRIALVECTIKIADFSEKVGKLVDRCGALTKALQASRHPAKVAAVLVCRQPRDQIAAQVEELRTHNVILLTREDLEAGFEQLRIPNDPDKMLNDAEASLAKKPRSPFEK